MTTRRRTGPGVALGVSALLLAVIIVGAVAGTWTTSPVPGGADTADPPTSATSTPDHPTSPTPRPTDPTATASPTSPPEPVSFTVLAAGDVLPHTSVLAAARTDDGWDFSPLWETVTPWVRSADLALCHLEVPVAPPGTTPVGYPVFGAPRELAENLARAGWDGCSTASNHSLDQGWPGVVTTLDELDAAGLGHVGTARSAVESEQPQVYELAREGETVTVAHLSTTFDLNGFTLPDGSPWAVDVLDTDRLVAQATTARAAGADLVIASVHCCEEYRDEPSPRQVEISPALAASGQIDLVIGNHSHVPQPMRRLQGGPDGTGMWVAYSMGNYISNQDALCCRPETGTGTLMWATVVKEPGGPARVTGLEWTALPGDRVGGQRIYAMPDLLDDRVDTPQLALSRDELVLRQQRVADVVGPEAGERRHPPTHEPARTVAVPRLS